MSIGFRELWESLKDERARNNFLSYTVIYENRGKSVGEYLFPYASTFMQMAVDMMAFDMLAKERERLRKEEERKGKHKR